MVLLAYMMIEKSECRKNITVRYPKTYHLKNFIDHSRYEGQSFFSYF